MFHLSIKKTLGLTATIITACYMQNNQLHAVKLAEQDSISATTKAIADADLESVLKLDGKAFNDEKQNEAKNDTASIWQKIKDIKNKQFKSLIADFFFVKVASSLIFKAVSEKFNNINNIPDSTAATPTKDALKIALCDAMTNGLKAITGMTEIAGIFTYDTHEFKLENLKIHLVLEKIASHMHNTLKILAAVKASNPTIVFFETIIENPDEQGTSLTVKGYIEKQLEKVALDLANALEEKLQETILAITQLKEGANESAKGVIAKLKAVGGVAKGLFGRWVQTLSGNATRESLSDIDSSGLDN